MKLKILEKKGNKLKLQVEGEEHTLLNLLRKTLWELPGVTSAAYNKPHPYVGNSTITVFVDKGSQLKKIEDAAQIIADTAEEFSVKFQRALKK